MNNSSKFNSIENSINTHIADRLLAIYSLILIFIGTPCNLLVFLIYFKKQNRTNSIKIIFSYLAILDTIVLYTFNLNYVIREFNIDYQIIYFNKQNQTYNPTYTNSIEHMNINIIKRNLEEYSLVMCRFLSYLGKQS